MNASRIDQAIQRIETALGRIDTAAEELCSGSAPDGELVQQHSALRKEVSSTLAELDQLIEGLEK